MEPDEVPFDAVNQRGLFTRPQAYTAGWTARQVRRRLQTGRWQVVAGAALAAVDLPVGPRELGQAVLLTWPDAVVSHELAGVLHGFPIPTPPVGTATVPPGRKLRAQGLTAHQRALRPDDVTRLGRLPITTEARTAADLLAGLAWDPARSLLAWLVTRRRYSREQLVLAVASRRQLAGTAQLRRLARVSATGSLSAAEDRFHRLLTEAGIDGWRANVPVRLGSLTFVVDVLFAASKVVVEIDGYGAHSGREAFQRDRARQNALVSAGYVVLRFTWDDLTRRPEHVVATLRASLSAK